MRWVERQQPPGQIRRSKILNIIRPPSLGVGSRGDPCASSFCPAQGSLQGGRQVSYDTGGTE